MKKLYVIIILLCTTYLFSQTDTLFVGSKKYPLQKTKVFYNDMHIDFPISLPIEYKPLKKNVFIGFNREDRRENFIEVDTNENEIIIGLVRPDSTDCNNSTAVSLRNFLDTIFVTNNEFSNLVIKIKSKGKWLPLCNYNIYGICDSVLQITHYTNISANTYYYANLFNSSIYTSEIEVRKKTTYIIKDLYYRRGNATYYLNRQFVVLVK